jgi:hypothetical protein
MSKLTEGCTLISWLASLADHILREHGCCQEHDLFYEQGGSFWTKVWVDWKLAQCVHAINGRGVRGSFKGTLGFLVVTLNPYAHIVWLRKTPE